MCTARPLLAVLVETGGPLPPSATRRTALQDGELPPAQSRFWRGGGGGPAGSSCPARTVGRSVGHDWRTTAARPELLARFGLPSRDGCRAARRGELEPAFVLCREGSWSFASSHGWAG